MGRKQAKIGYAAFEAAGFGFDTRNSAAVSRVSKREENGMASWEIELKPSEVERIVAEYARSHLGVKGEVKIEAVNGWPYVNIKMGAYPPASD